MHLKIINIYFCAGRIFPAYRTHKPEEVQRSSPEAEMAVLGGAFLRRCIFCCVWKYPRSLGCSLPLMANFVTRKGLASIYRDVLATACLGVPICRSESTGLAWLAEAEPKAVVKLHMQRTQGPHAAHSRNTMSTVEQGTFKRPKWRRC